MNIESAESRQDHGASTYNSTNAGRNSTQAAQEENPRAAALSVARHLGDDPPAAWHPGSGPVAGGDKPRVRPGVARVDQVPGGRRFDQRSRLAAEAARVT